MRRTDYQDLKNIFQGSSLKKASIAGKANAFPLPSSKGFSLIEVVIVLSLAGLLTTIAVYQINPAIKKYRLTAAARLVFSDLLNARTIALKENRSIRIDFSSTSYSLVQVDTDASILTRALSAEYPDITVAKQGGGSVIFTSTGQTSAATVQIQGPSATRTITLSWTGRVVLN